MEAVLGIDIGTMSTEGILVSLATGSVLSRVNVEYAPGFSNPEGHPMGAEQKPKAFRLAPGREVRLKHAYYVTCVDVVRDQETGEVTELHCTYDPETRGGGSPDGRKVRGTLHWVSAPHALDAEVRLYDHLFSRLDPLDVEEGHDFTEDVGPGSLEILNACKVEPGLSEAAVGDGFQFLRLGYFCMDPDTRDAHLVFSRTVTLRDTWARIQKAQARSKP